MIRSLYSAASGMLAQQTNIDVIANNLANVNTPGFKGSTPQFEDLLYDTQKQPGTTLGSGEKTPDSLAVGYGTKVVSTARDFTQGEFVAGDAQYSLAISGRGFFKVLMADGSGTNAYTRAGNFTLNANGEIVTQDGAKLVGAPTIPTGTQSVAIGTDGTVTLTDSTGATTNAGQITLSDFINPNGLKAQGNNLFTETDASGTPTEGKPGLQGLGSLQQGYVENSNVSVVNEMVKMITAQRAYEVNSKAIQAADNMMQQADNLRQ